MRHSPAGPLLSALLVFQVCTAALAAQDGARTAKPAPYAATSTYARKTIEGFRVLVSAPARERPAELREVLDLLTQKLRELRRAAPAPARKRLADVRIWLEWEAKPNGAAEYHPSVEWLRDNGYNPEKARGVEINNLRNFTDWSRRAQPMMVLHELAHALMDRLPPEERERIAAAYEAAKARGNYESVEYVLGGKKRAYALNNPMEYFAELSEAFFGKNDFYPFTREELRAHDPEGFAAVERAWSGDRGGDRGESRSAIGRGGTPEPGAPDPVPRKP
jgi:hypothetical protein